MTYRRLVMTIAATMCLGWGVTGRAQGEEPVVEGGTAEVETAATQAEEAAAAVAAEPDPSDPVPVTLDELERGCTDGVAVDCGALGHVYRNGTDAPRDLPHAIAMFQKACDLSDGADFGAYSCHFLASHYESGDGVVQDLGRALRLYEKSCQAGNEDSCSQANVVRLAAGTP